MSESRRAMAWMILFTLFWVIVEVVASRLSAPYSGYQVVWTRYAVHLVFMAIVWGWREPSSLWHTRRPVLELARSMFMVGMPMAVIVAVSRGSDGDTAFAIFWIAPLLAITMARVFLNERASTATWLAAATASAGAAIALWRGAPSSPLLMALPLVSATSFSAYVTMTRVLRHEHVRANLFYTAFGVCVVLSPVMPSVWVAPTLRDAVLLSGVGVFGFVALYALDRMASVAPISITAPLGPLQVVFAVGAGAAITDQRADTRTLVGIACIGATAVWVWSRAGLISEGSAR
jgi:drug/metabolite transporter (DMT)-like permease